MPTTSLEFFGEVPLYFGMGVKILTALLLGGLIGFDREQKMKSAGIKTNMMICLGATLYTAVSLINHEGSPIADPNRVAAQVVSGIGFLGAGAIIRGGGSITGLTTAATIWVVAAIGVTVGSGYPVVATLFTLTIFAVLRFLNPVYKLLEREKFYQDYHIEILSQGSVRRIISNILASEHVPVQKVDEHIVNKKTKEHLLNLYLSTHPRRINVISREINSVIQVQKVSLHQVDFGELEID
jgi:putative Mg2+ transporter-C (MgtC) family protein